MSDDMPPSSDYLDVPGCDIVVMSPENRPITISRAAAILLRLAGTNPDAKVHFWVKVLD
jgi:hypothetical protein